jgi:hypothetical protein
MDDPTSVLTADELAAARAAAQAAPPLTGHQCDVLRAIFGPALRQLAAEHKAA